MGNSTEQMLFQEERNEFEHPFYIKVTITTLSVLFTLSWFVINRRLFKFFGRPNKRFLDQIVQFQISVSMIVSAFLFPFFNLLIWAKVPKHYVTEVGCYIGSYIFTFLAPYIGVHSFFIAFFRYICIIHPDKLSRLKISPEKFGRITVIMELLFALVTAIFLWLPNIPENSSSVLNCLGDDDVIYFKYDYFKPGGYSRKKKYCQFDNMIGKYACNGSLVLLMLVSSNVLEIYLTTTVMFEIKKSTKSVTRLLSGKSLADRKRDDGIVIGITFWQWFIELVFNLLLIGFVAGLGANRRVDHFVGLASIWIGTSLVPSFYFMACAEFRRDLETHGLLKAFWIAITKDNYENYS